MRKPKTVKLECCLFTCRIICYFQILLSLVQEHLRDEVEEYTRIHRGKELPGFVSYRTFQNIVRRHVEDLEEPAMNLLQTTTG